MDREQIDGWCEKGILGLVLGILVFGPLAFGGHAAPQFLVLQALTIGVMALWILRLWIGRQQFLWPPICWAVAAFMLYAVARYFTADIEYVARNEMLRVLVYGFLFFAILNNLHRQESIQVITLALMFLGMALAIYAGYQFVSKSPRIWNVVEKSYIGRGRGTFVYPNHLAGFLEMLFPLAICYVVIGRLGHVTKIFLGYAAVVMLVGIGVTLSRGGWIVMSLELVVLCGVLLAQRDFRLQGFALLAVLVLGGALVIPRLELVHARIARTVQSGRPDDMRLAIWPPAVKIWRDHFWWGAGPAHFDYRFSAYRPIVVQLRPDRVHNDYLNTLVDWGVVGTVLVASAWLLLARGILKTWRTVRGGRDDFSRKKSNKFAFLIGGSIGLVGILLHSFLDFNMQMPANAILAVTLMALLSSQWRFETERFWFRANAILKIAASMVLLAGIAYLSATGVRSARESVALHRAEQIEQQPHQSYSYARIAALEKAFRIEPKNFDTANAIAECYRLKSWDGNDDYAVLAKKAMEWYQRAMTLDPYDQYNWLNYGRCLDWIGPDQAIRQDADTYYQRANQLDPNGYFTTAIIGWHYVQSGDLSAARTWFERAELLEPSRTINKMTYDYLAILENRLERDAQTHKQP